LGLSSSEVYHVYEFIMHSNAFPLAKYASVVDKGLPLYGNIDMSGRSNNAYALQTCKV
jgi:hypothetical protein